MFQQLRLSAAAQKARDAGHPSFLIDRRMSETGIAASLTISNPYRSVRRGTARCVAFMGERRTIRSFVAARPRRMPPSAQAAGFPS